MKTLRFPRMLFLGLAAMTAAAPVAALPPLHADLVDDAMLASMRGKYFGANLLVGLRIDLISTLGTQAGSAGAAGSLVIRRVGNGFEVYVDSHSFASDSGVLPATGDTDIATGGQTLQINGIGQVTQVAGDGNHMNNLTLIRFVPDTAFDISGFNGQTGSDASAGAMTAHISFVGGGVQLGLTGPGANLSQQFRNGNGSGQLFQLGQLAGNGMFGSNQLQLQLFGTAMSASMLNQLGVQQALAGLSGVGR
jgi:hypothetical protein